MFCVCVKSLGGGKGFPPSCAHFPPVLPNSRPVPPRFWGDLFDVFVEQCNLGHILADLILDQNISIKSANVLLQTKYIIFA